MPEIDDEVAHNNPKDAQIDTDDAPIDTEDNLLFSGAVDENQENTEVGPTQFIE